MFSIKKRSYLIAAFLILALVVVACQAEPETVVEEQPAANRCSGSGGSCGRPSLPRPRASEGQWQPRRQRQQRQP